MKFSESIKVGRIGEELVKQLLDWAGVNTSYNDSSDVATLKKHDIRCELNGVLFSVESKFDSKQSETGNICVEYANPRTGKPSGLLATTAELWAIVLRDPMAVWVCRTKDLQGYFESTKPIKTVLRAGDGNASVRIFNSDHLLNSICRRIDEEPPWEVLSILTTLLLKKSVNGKLERLANPLQDGFQKQRASLENRHLSG